MPLQKHHHIFDGFLFLPRRNNQRHFFGADTGHFLQSLWGAIKHRQSVHIKMRHDALCRFGANAFNQPTAQIFANAGGRGGQHRAIVLHHKLPAVLVVVLPEAGKFKRLAHVHPGQRAHNRAEGAVGVLLAALIRQQLGDGVARLLALEGNALDDAG